MIAPPSPRDDPKAEAVKQQWKAIVPDRSIWVAASAGTGKTTVLTSRVLSLMLSGADPDRILCLTYTKAAAAEMAARIAGRLKIWATAGEQELDGELHGLLGRAPDDRERRRARQLFAEVLDLPGGLAIHTIHAFCQSLLARFPLEAGIAPHSTLLEERAAKELLVSLREELLAKAAGGDGGALADSIRHLARLVADQGFQDLIDAISQHESRFADAEAFILPRLKQLLGVAREVNAATLTAAICAEGAFDRPALERAASALAAGSKRDQEMAAKLAPWLEADEAGRRYGLKAYASAFYKKDGELKAEDKLTTNKTEDAHPGARAALLAEQERLHPAMARLRKVELYEANEALVRLAVELLQRYRRAKRERALLDYNDLIDKARALLSTADGLNAWVLYKLDGGLDHLLVDESQDTNRAQWRVIDGLTEEFFSGAGAHEDRSPIDRTIFSVGDVKQSIFSFQGAEPRAFLEQRDIFRGRIEAAGRGFDNVGLAHSFRSAPAVLGLVDRVFAGEAVRQGMLLGEDWPLHRAIRAGQAGRIELWPLVGPKLEDAGDGADAWSVPREGADSATGAALLARQIAATIEGWLTSPAGPGEPGWLDARDRRVAPGDIMILVRRRNHFVDEMVRALKLKGIPVAGVDRMILTDQLAVQDLVALGRAMLLPEDDLNLAGLLKSPFCGLCEEQLFTLAHAREGKTLWSVLRDRRGEHADFERCAAFLEELAERADYLSPFAFYAELLSAKGGRKALLSRLGEDAGDPIDEFLSQALLYERENHPSLEGFLHWLAASDHEVKRDLDRGGDKVRVMTVHGAKGLEAPIVFLPDTHQLPQGPKTPLYWIDDGDGVLPLWVPAAAMEDEVAAEAKARKKAAELEEHRRLLYVALTRAEDRLYVCGYKGKKNQKSEEDWYSLVRAAIQEWPQAEPLRLTVHPEAEGPWEEEGFVVAEPQRAAPVADRRPEELAPVEVLPGWALRPAAPEPEELRVLRPSGDGEGEPAATSPRPPEGEEISGIARGLIIHRLLELLPGLEEERQEQAGAQLLARPVWGLSRGLQRALLRETLDVLRHREFAPIFGPAGLAEVPVVGELTLTGPEGAERRRISGQIDRLLVMEKEILVVDYKTNRPPPIREAEVSPAYLRQMAAYRAVLREIYPGREVKAALLWTDAPRLMHISHDLMDQHAP